ncbi:CLUMA_CG001204, isoform A [Clunio marinus]|uniref:CLUMA_CG001204, isoform A n=1 Tax=Clunio marinus TaxID=568069 RepID=A0A1J1HIL9_9DIPT|nr:CLUMA_CG001204, isoform A [Clunio marinus]
MERSHGANLFEDHPIKYARLATVSFAKVCGSNKMYAAAKKELDKAVSYLSLLLCCSLNL